MSTQFHVIIPARWHSTRLPEKMLADIGGLPMVVRTARQALQAGAESVTIATDDTRILQTAKTFGISAILTRTDHPSGTDRLSEAIAQLGLNAQNIVVNVQGDEPMIDPKVIRLVADALQTDNEADISTCASPCAPENINNPNAVKVVLDRKDRALYFSRAPIPFVRHGGQSGRFLHHIGIYGYRCSFLETFPRLEPGELEQAEMLEQLRALEHGFKIHVCVTDHLGHGGVDTPDDLLRIQRLFHA